MMRAIHQISILALLAACSVEYTVTGEGGGGTDTASTDTGTGTMGSDTGASGATHGGEDCSEPGQIQCGNRCIDPLTDAAHCGDCGHACAPGDVCVEGECEDSEGGTDDGDSDATDGDTDGTSGHGTESPGDGSG